MKKCKRCGEAIIEGAGYCDSDRCLREAKDYEEFIAKHGDYCFSCYSKGIVPPPPPTNIPFCPNCGDNASVVPCFNIYHEQVSWLCQVCYWEKEVGDVG